MFETSHVKLYFDKTIDAKISGTTLLQNQTSLFGLLTSGTLSTQTAKAVIAIKNCDPGNLDCHSLGKNKGEGMRFVAIKNCLPGDKIHIEQEWFSIQNCDHTMDCEY